MAIALLVAFLAVGWVLTGVLYVFRIRGLRETIGYLEVAREELMQSALDAEKRAGVAETESQYMKLTLANVLQRPAVAVMTDENIQQLGAIIESVMKAPDKLN
jgi:ribosomal protein L10